MLSHSDLGSDSMHGDQLSCVLLPQSAGTHDDSPSIHIGQLLTLGIDGELDGHPSSCGWVAGKGASCEYELRVSTAASPVADGLLTLCIRHDDEMR